MKIIIIQLGRIGDMVLTTPMFRAIKEKMPGAQLHVFSSFKASSIVHNNPYLDKIYIYRKGIKLLYLIFKLWREKYDIWIDPKDHYSAESNLLARLSSAKKKIGFNKKDQSVFDISLPSDEEYIGLQATERNILALKTLGITKGINRSPDIYIANSIKERILLEFTDKKKEIAVINISAGNDNRKWRLEKWVEVIQFLESKQYQVAIIYDPSDMKEAQTIYKCHLSIKTMNSPSIEYASAVISIAKLIVTPDTAVVHIASAFNIPIVALFPNIEWNYTKFKPLSSKQKIVFPEKGEEVCDIFSSAVIDAISKIL